MTLRKIYQHIWAIAGAVSVRAKILGIVLGFIILLGVGVMVQSRYALTATMTAQLEEQSISVSRDLAARASDPILLNDLLSLHDLLDETLASNPNVRYAFIAAVHGIEAAKELIRQNPTPYNKYILENLHDAAALIRQDISGRKMMTAYGNKISTTSETYFNDGVLSSLDTFMGYSKTWDEYTKGGVR